MQLQLILASQGSDSSILRINESDPWQAKMASATNTYNSYVDLWKLFFIYTQAPLPPSWYRQHARKCVPPSTRRSVEPTTLPTVRI